MSENTKDRIVAIARLAVTLIAAVAGGFGLTVDPDALYTLAACAIALAAGVYSWYKNNNLTQAATQAQNYLESIKKLSADSEDDEEDTEEAVG